MFRTVLFAAFAAIGISTAIIPVAQAEQIKAAITAQIVPVDQKKPAVVEVTTVVKHPARVSVRDVKTPKGIKLRSVKRTSKCSPKSKAGATCKERHNLMLDIRKVCRLSGTYKVAMSVKCMKSPNSACKAATETITLKLKSENFCEAKSINVPK